jgi:hypothetical protein
MQEKVEISQELFISFFFQFCDVAKVPISIG